MTDIYGYGGDPSYGGGANLGGILSALGSLPASVIRALYAKPGLPTSNTFDQRFGSLPPAQAAPLPAAINVGSAPNINTAGVPQGQQPQPDIMNQQLSAGGPDPALMGGPNPSPIATGGQGGGAGPMAGPPIGRGPLGAGGGLFGALGNLAGGSSNPIGAVLGGLGNMFQQMAISGSPALQQIYYQRLIAAQMFNGLIQRGMPADQALAIVSNPELQRQFYGAPAHVGDVKAGGVEVPVLAGQTGIQYGVPGGGGQGGLDQLAAMGARFSQQQKAAEATGTAQGQANAVLPTVSNNFDTAIAGVDRVLQDPNLNTRLGAKSIIPPIPQTAAYDTQTKINELTGSLLPAAIQELQSRGAGVRNPGLANDLANAISDVKNAQGGTPGAFRESMTNLRHKLIQLKGAAYEQAGQQAPQQMETPLSGVTKSGVNWSISH